MGLTETQEADQACPLRATVHSGDWSIIGWQWTYVLKSRQSEGVSTLRICRTFNSKMAS